jgi:HPt (histidine-containing phosphotransfer) domain-containing protein
MDCQMPVMDGYEATRRIRAAGLTIPVLALTANAMESDRQRCRAAGMDDVLVKPVRPDTLREAVARLAPRPTPALAPVPAVKTPAVAGTDTPPDAAFTFDEEAVLARVAGNRELFLDISRLFIEHSRTLLGALSAAVAARDGKALASSAHALKGSISTFTQAGPYLTAAAMEQQAADGHVDAACALVPRIDRELAALCAALDQCLSAHELESAN